MALRIARGLLVLSSAVAADDLHFLVMGDWGGTDHSPWTHTAEVNTAKQMDKAAAALGAKFSLALGDNFYYSGVTSADDDRFQNTFEQCFDGDSLSNGHTFHVIAGNHDHIGDVQAQIDYSKKSSRWSFPSLYYTFSKTASDGTTVQFVMIDTVSVAGQSQRSANDATSLKGSELPGPANLTVAQSQLQWIDETLAASTADYVIVSGHYPVYSVGDHGPTSQLSPSNFPYLQKYKVSAYLCGHDHSEQHIDKGDGVQYHVIGSANLHSGWGHISSVSSGQLKYHDNKDNGGYATVSVNKKGMVIKHYAGDGTLAYTAPAIPPRGSSGLEGALV
jgi:tartrate-resistant acid phosphatase type 5